LDIINIVIKILGIQETSAAFWVWSSSLTHDIKRLLPTSRPALALNTLPLLKRFSMLRNLGEAPRQGKSSILDMVEIYD
jgi:hypothetical protein